MSTTLESDVTDLWDRYQNGLDAAGATGDDRAVLDAFLDALEAGEVRAAEPVDGHGNGPEGWTVNEWVKRGVLLNFGLRETVARDYGGVDYHDVLPLRRTDDLGARGTRNTPDGTVLRRGSYLGADCIAMSPAFVNVGAYVDDGTLVDSCDVVGSCAQIGANVKLGANTLIGGVLEPVEDAPVVIEDGASIGAGCRVVSGFHVGENAVVGENTLLTPRLPVYDLVAEEVIYGEIPAERRAFTRYVESSIGDHDLFAGGAYKPAVVAMDVAEDTRDATRREEALRE
jgi:2,3,4,5-tetrahydropyridine-2-carboxylate N-succinyltransferase